MKAIRALIIAIAVLAAGCGSDEPTAPITGNGSMTAKVNGDNWGATAITAVYSGGNVSIGGTQIAGGSSKQFNISGMMSGPGTYSVGLLTPTRIQYSEGSMASVKTFLPKSGQIVVESLSSTGAKGTFSFEAQEQVLGGGQGTDTRSITNGSFDVKFQ